MLYDVYVELDKYNETIICVRTQKTILKYEIVFGVQSFFEIMFFLFKTDKIYLECKKHKYLKQFLWEKSAIQFYNNLLMFIKNNKYCEIV